MDKEIIRAIGFIEMGILFAMILLLKKKLFPKMAFEIGKSANVGRSAGYWRSIAFVVVILGFLVGVLASVFANRLS